MSNIYIQEPPSNGKVLLVTSVGDIDVELWSKEAPKACRNFVQLCMEGYYDGTIFHRVVREFIVQGGDPTGSGQGGESIYGAPFKDEFHTRLRFARRGLVAMANAGPNDNGSQFFFTMGATQELQNKHTIFGKVTGNTVFNMLKLQECETDAEERPLLPNKIIRTEILSNPYDDIIPRILKKKKDDVDKKPKSKSKATKNFKLLSFGEEAEEDEEQATKVSEGWKGKSKSSHDLANDPRLSAKPALDVSPSRLEKRKEMTDSDSDDKVVKVEKEERVEKTEKEESPRKKLKKDIEEKPVKKVVEEKPPKKVVEEKPPRKVVEDKPPKKVVEDKPPKKVFEDKPPKKVISPEKMEESYERKLPTKTEDLKQEAKRLKREIRESIRREEERKMETMESKDEEVKEAAPASNDPLADFKKERLKYKTLRKQQGKKGSEREQITLAILDKFKSKLDTARKLASDYSDDEKDEEGEEEDDVTDMSWMHHKLQFEEQKKKVIDANISDLDRYEIHDPRNPLTKRRRETSKQVMKERR